MVVTITCLVIAAILLMLLISQHQVAQRAKASLRDAQEKNIQLENRIESSRIDLKKSKEDLERERNALREMRELSKKKLRRQAMAADMDLTTISPEADMNDKALEDSNKAIAALETQIEQLKRDQNISEEAMREKLAAEMAKKQEANNSETDELKRKIAELQEELKKQRRLMRPEGNKIDLKILPDEAAAEFSRVYRKAEQHERLHGIARAKLHLAQEKFTELQKRYFSVCRELAVAAGNQENLEPKAARDIAEKIVAEHSNESST